MLLKNWTVKVSLLAALAILFFIVLPLLAQRPVPVTGLPPQVVDSTGKVLGVLIGYSHVAREVNGFWVDIYLSTDKLGDSAPWTYPPASYTTVNCTGQPYLPLDLLPRRAFLINNLLYYPNGVPQTPDILSHSDPDNSNVCVLGPKYHTQFYAPLARQYLSGFTPPFDARQSLYPINVFRR